MCAQHGRNLIGESPVTGGTKPPCSYETCGWRNLGVERLDVRICKVIIENIYTNISNIDLTLCNR